MPRDKYKSAADQHSDAYSILSGVAAGRSVRAAHAIQDASNHFTFLNPSTCFRRKYVWLAWCPVRQ